jgi:3-oxoacyl-[acyl-carrier-protein] synthase II
MGTVNALTAGGTSALAAGLADSRTGIGRVGAFPVEDCSSRLAAEVAEATLAGLIDRDEARRLSRICRLAVAGARLAVDDAQVAGGAGLALVVGSEHGDFRSSQEFADGYLRRGPTGLSPMLFPNTVMNTMAAVAAIAVEARAPSVTLNQPTVVGDLAVARGVSLVANGRADAVVAGGVDEVCEVLYRELAALGALSPMRGADVEGCRPFADDHNGPVLGEGATFLVLEALDHATRRGAPIIAEIAEVAWGNVPVPPHRARAARIDEDSPVQRLLRARSDVRSGFRRCYGAGNGDPDLDDWERALLARDLPGSAPDLFPPVSLASRFGQHGGLGALRVAAAALDIAAGVGPVLVHGIARGGCRVALVLTAVSP